MISSIVFFILKNPHTYHRRKMDGKKSKTTYKEFMKQLEKAKIRMGRSLYKRLEAEFAKPKVHKTQ